MSFDAFDTSTALCSAIIIARYSARAKHDACELRHGTEALMHNFSAHKVSMYGYIIVCVVL